MEADGDWSSMRRRDFVLGVIVAALFALVLIWVIPNEIQSDTKVPLLHPSSTAFMPSLMALLVLVLSLSISIKAWLTVETFPKPKESLLSSRSTKLLLRAGLAVLVAFGYYLLLDALGALATAIGISVLLIVLAGERSPKRLLLAGIVTPTVIYWLFVYLASAPLPRGVFSF